MRKPRKIVAGCLATIMLLTGCTTKNVLTTDVGDITADYMYSSLKTPEDEFNFTYAQLFKKKFPATDNMKKQAESEYKQLEKSYINQYGKKKYKKKLKESLSMAGLSSKSGYLKSQLKYQQEMKLLDYYVKHHYSDEFNVYWKKAKPKKISVITVSLAGKGKMTDKERKFIYGTVIKNIKKSGFAKTAQKYSEINSSANGSVGVIDKYNRSSAVSLSDKMIKKLYKMKAGETSGVMINEYTAVIAHLDSDDKNTIKKYMKKSAGVGSPMVTYDSTIKYRAFLSFNIKYSDSKMKKDVTKYAKEMANE